MAMDMERVIIMYPQTAEMILYYYYYYYYY
jgi:hypothetical protein